MPVANTEQILLRLSGLKLLKKDLQYNGWWIGMPARLNIVRTGKPR